MFDLPPPRHISTLGNLPVHQGVDEGRVAAPFADLRVADGHALAVRFRSGPRAAAAPCGSPAAANSISVISATFFFGPTRHHPRLRPLPAKGSAV
jgi:hypothetical protein